MSSLPKKEPEAARALFEMPAPPQRPAWLSAAPQTVVPLGEALTRQVAANTQKELSHEEDVALGNVYREAYEEGLRAARAAVTTIMGRYQTAIDALDKSRAWIMEESERDLVTLALALAKAALGVTAEDRESYTVWAAKSAIEMLRQADEINLHVSPTDMHALAEIEADLQKGSPTVKLVVDPTINVGGIVAECRIGRVDARIERRLDELAGELRSRKPLVASAPVVESKKKGDPR